MILKLNSFFNVDLKIVNLNKKKRCRFFSSKNSRKSSLKYVFLKKYSQQMSFNKNFVLKYYSNFFLKKYLLRLKHLSKVDHFQLLTTRLDFKRSFIYFKKSLIAKNKYLIFSKKKKFRNSLRFKNIKFFYCSLVYYKNLKKSSGNTLFFLKNRLFPLKKYFKPTKKILFQQTNYVLSSFLYFRLVNIFIKSGLKSKIEINVQSMIFQFKDFFFNSIYKTVYSHNFIFLSFMLYVPKMTVKGVRRGSVVYKVPFLITPFQQISIFFKWFKDSVNLRNETSYKVRLFKEIFDLLDENTLSETLKKKSSLNKAVITGRSFSHYRWI